MSTISMGLTTSPPTSSNIQTYLIVTGLTDGVAYPGDTLRVSLSNGRKITDYAWGSTPEGSEYGIDPTLVVPAEAANSVLYVTVYANKQQFTTTANVESAPEPETVIQPGTNEIIIESLAFAPALPALTLSAGSDTIIVEIA